jgi:hypothetical protein
VRPRLLQYKQMLEYREKVSPASAFLPVLNSVIPASRDSPVLLVTDKSGIAQLCHTGMASWPCPVIVFRARICKCLWSPGIDSEESISPAYVAWRASTTNRVSYRPAKLRIDTWSP